ncbi:hypothetical protein KEM54_000687 [Ascosphaera aggregata]|nr:hypothetical protein KEM54_000687 [Ascosphaera aggregata]
MDKVLTPQEKLSLITSHLQEVLKPELLEDIVTKQDRPLSIYFGTAPTGRPHCGYFVPIVKLAHFLRAGCSIKILLADIHAFLDNLKAPIDLVAYRTEYYRKVITAMLETVGVPTDKLEFVKGSDYQKSAEYTMDVYRLTSIVSEHDAKRAGAEVVKQVDNAPMSGLLYPLMQALDEEHLGVDAQFGGVDQRKIFTLAQETLPRLGYKERAHLMNPMVPGLAGGKMSSSDPDSKIDILDNAEAVKRKLKKAYAMPKEVEGNGIISFVEYVLLPISALSNAEGKGEFVVERREEEGGRMAYNDIETLKADYAADKLTPQLLKNAVTVTLQKILAPIQEKFLADMEWQEIERRAYPPPPKAEKKAKKPKNKGSKYPGATKQGAAETETETKTIEEGVEKMEVKE